MISYPISLVISVIFSLIILLLVGVYASTYEHFKKNEALIETCFVISVLLPCLSTLLHVILYFYKKNKSKNLVSRNLIKYHRTQDINDTTASSFENEIVSININEINKSPDRNIFLLAPKPKSDAEKKEEKNKKAREKRANRTEEEKKLDLDNERKKAAERKAKQTTEEARALAKRKTENKQNERAKLSTSTKSNIRSLDTDAREIERTKLSLIKKKLILTSDKNKHVSTYSSLNDEQHLKRVEQSIKQKRISRCKQKNKDNTNKDSSSDCSSSSNDAATKPKISKPTPLPNQDLNKSTHFKDNLILSLKQPSCQTKVPTKVQPSTSKKTQSSTSDHTSKDSNIVPLNFPYFRQQTDIKESCFLAVNNALQETLFTLQEIEGECLKLHNDTNIAPKRTIDLLECCFENHNIQSHFCVKSHLLPFLTSDEPLLFILGQKGQMLSIRRFIKGGNLIVFNSEFQQPYINDQILVEINRNDKLEFLDVNVQDAMKELRNIAKAKHPYRENIVRPLPTNIEMVNVEDDESDVDDHLGEDMFEANETDNNIEPDIEIDDFNEPMDGDDSDPEVADETHSDFDVTKGNFCKNVSRWHVEVCYVCKQTNFKCTRTTNPETYRCPRCLKTMNKTLIEQMFFANNGPSSLPSEEILPSLSLVEEQLIAMVFVNQYCYLRMPSGCVASKGHCINFAQNITPICQILPRLAKDIPIVIIEKKHFNYNKQGQLIELRVRRMVVEKWLHYLKQHSPAYFNINIREENLDLLPEDGYIDLPTIQTHKDMNNLSKETNINPNDLIEPEVLANEEISSSFNSQLNLNDVHQEPAINTGFIQINDFVDSEETQLGNLATDLLTTRPTISNINTNKAPPFTSNQAPNGQDPPRIPFPVHDTNPLSEFNTPNLASMAFPSLFPDGMGDPFRAHIECDLESRLNIIKNLVKFCEMINGERICRFAQHPRFILWIYNLTTRHNTMKQGTIFLKQNPGQANLTIDQLKAMVGSGNKNDVVKNMQRYLANIVGTPSYWHKVSTALDTVCAVKGPPHIFFTHSYADNYDPDLHRILQIQPGTSKVLIKKKIRDNPHIVCEFFIKKMTEMKNEYYIKRLKACPKYGGWIIGRYEYQHRGTLHFHGLARFGDAPDIYLLTSQALEGYIASQKIEKSPQDLIKINYGVDCERQIIEFHDKYINCDSSESFENYIAPGNDRPMPMSIRTIDVLPENSSRDLLDLIYCLQRHKCIVGACLKYDEHGKLGACRFRSHENVLSPETKIVYIRPKKKDNSLGEWQMKILPKRTYDTRIVHHMVEQIKLFRSNCDASLINDLKRLIQYVNKYATKSETTSGACNAAFDTIFADAESDLTNTHKAMQQVLNKVIGQRDISSPEAVHHLLGLDMHTNSYTVITTSLDFSKQLARNNRTHVIELKDSLVDAYANRHEFLQTDNNLMSMNFYDFALKYQMSKKTIKLRPNQETVVIQIFQKFSASPKNATYYLYCKYQLLRYKPWQTNHNNALIRGCQDNEEGWIRSWIAFLETPIGKQSVPTAEQALSNARIAVDETEDEQPIDPLLVDDEDRSGTLDEMEDWMRVQGERSNPVRMPTTTFSDNTEALAYAQVDSARFDAETINGMKNWIPNQKAALDPRYAVKTRPVVDASKLNADQRFALKILEDHVKQPDNRSLKNPNAKQLCMRIEGEAGHGKSFLLNAMCNLLDKYSPKDCMNFYHVCAPTGRAAHGVLGTTCCSLFCLGIGEFNDLGSESLIALQKRFAGSVYCFADEYGMIGQIMAGKIDKRLRKATGINKPFGGINMIWFGDRKQLPPVLDHSLWYTKCTSTKPLSIAGRALWKSFNVVVNLTVNVRQNDPAEQPFRDFLGRLRDARCIRSDYDLLAPRVTGQALDEARFQNALYLIYDNWQVDDFNMEALELLGTRQCDPQRSIRIDAEHNRPEAARMSSDVMMGLQSSLIIARSCRVMITSNLWTQQGITNGATGTLRFIIYNGTGRPPALPLAVIVELDDEYHGPHLPGLPRHVVINPITRGLNTNSGRLERTMLPLRVAFAITIHKCQGK